MQIRRCGRVIKLSHRVRASGAKRKPATDKNKDIKTEKGYESALELPRGNIFKKKKMVKIQN